MPDKKNLISVKIDGTKEKRRKRRLLDDIINVLRNYFEEKPYNPVEEGKLFQFKPI